ncbi:MAG: hypothetical protein RLZZ508_999 [Actinomycetota bacterium]|jgi:hypothetical protein
MRLLLYVIPIALHLYVLFDIFQTKVFSLMPRWAWFCVQIVPIIGPLLWIISGRRGNGYKRGYGPDDDPDFLRKL